MAIFRDDSSRGRHVFAPLALLLVVLAVALTACGANNTSDPVLVGKVDGQPITLAAYQRVLSVYSAIDVQNGTNNNWRQPDGRNALQSTQQQAFDFLVNYQIMRAQLSKLHISVPQSQVDAARKTLNDQLEQQREAAKSGSSTTSTGVLDALTPEAIDLFSQEQAAQTVLMQHAVVPSVHVRWIIVSSKDDADKYLQQVQGGADFAALAKAHSLDTGTADKGGEVGTVYIGQLSSYGPDFDEMVFAPGAHPAKYIEVPLSDGSTTNYYAVMEVTNPDTAALKDVGDSTSQSTIFTSWLNTTLRPQAKVESYVTLG